MHRFHHACAHGTHILSRSALARTQSPTPRSPSAATCWVSTRRLRRSRANRRSVLRTLPLRRSTCCVSQTAVVERAQGLALQFVLPVRHRALLAASTAAVMQRTTWTGASTSARARTTSASPRSTRARGRRRRRRSPSPTRASRTRTPKLEAKFGLLREAS
jgi:hypothetical protein